MLRMGANTGAQKHTPPKKTLCKVSNNLNIYWTSLSKMATCFKNNQQYHFSSKVTLFYCNHSAPFRKSRILNGWMKLYLVEQWSEHFKTISFSLTIPRGRPTLQLATAFMKTTYPSKRRKRPTPSLPYKLQMQNPKRKEVISSILCLALVAEPGALLNTIPTLNTWPFFL